MGLDVHAHCSAVGKCTPQNVDKILRRVLSKGEELAWAGKVGCWDALMMWVGLFKHPHPGLCNRTTTPPLSYLDDVLDLIGETVSGNLAWFGALRNLALVDALQMASAIWLDLDVRPEKVWAC